MSVLANVRERDQGPWWRRVREGEGERERERERAIYIYSCTIMILECMFKRLSIIFSKSLSIFIHTVVLTYSSQVFAEICF